MYMSSSFWAKNYRVSTYLRNDNEARLVSTNSWFPAQGARKLEYHHEFAENGGLSNVRNERPLGADNDLQRNINYCV